MTDAFSINFRWINFFYLYICSLPKFYKHCIVIPLWNTNSDSISWSCSFISIPFYNLLVNSVSQFQDTCMIRKADLSIHWVFFSIRCLISLLIPGNFRFSDFSFHYLISCACFYFETSVLEFVTLTTFTAFQVFVFSFSFSVLKVSFVVSIAGDFYNYHTYCVLFHISISFGLL